MAPPSSEPQPASASRRIALAAQFSLACCVGLLFARVVHYPFIAFDDAELIVRNPEISAPLSAPLELLLTPRVGYIIPVTVVFEAVLHALSQGEPWSFHAAALVLHVVYVLQLFGFARALGANVVFAWLAALLFALHPLVVQPVAWAICIKDLLMANLLLLGTRLFMRADAERAQAGRLGAAFGCAMLAMLAKPSASLLGLAWLVFAFVSGRRDQRSARNVALYVAIACALAGVGIGFASRSAHDARLGADALAAWSPTTPFTVLGRQLAHVVWPQALAIVYPAPVDEPAPLLTMIGALAVLVFVAFCFVVRARPQQLLVVLLAATTYLPTSNLLPFGRVISDSYMYVPLSMLSASIALELSRLRWTATPRARVVSLGLGASIALLLALSSSAQLEAWRGGRSLWDPVVRANPRFQLAHRLMGDELVLRGQPQQAAIAYRRAYALYYDPRYLLQFGTILSMANRIEDAECVLLEAVAFGGDRGYALYNYGALLAFNADYVSKYPSIAKQLLSELDRLRQGGALAWPPLLEPGLARQRERLRGAPAIDHAWAPRSCAVLQTERS